MASVVFFRAVNVGTHQRFQPGILAKQLKDFGVVNIGAAGTFVVREKISTAKLRSEILYRLPFQPELMICPARDVLALADHKLFHGASGGQDVQRFVTVLQKAPASVPPLPFQAPAGNKWEIRLVALSGQFALCWRRPSGPGKFYPNAVVEKLFGVPATTRNWNTISTIHRLLIPGAL
jgi:uncharacterized protein (DUF1697 family)